MLLHIVNNIYVARFIHDSFHYDRMSIDALNGLKILLSAISIKTIWLIFEYRKSYGKWLVSTPS